MASNENFKQWKRPQLQIALAIMISLLKKRTGDSPGKPTAKAYGRSIGVSEVLEKCIE